MAKVDVISITERLCKHIYMLYSFRYICVRSQYLSYALKKCKFCASLMFTYLYFRGHSEIHGDGDREMALQTKPSKGSGIN